MYVSMFIHPSVLYEVQLLAYIHVRLLGDSSDLVPLCRCVGFVTGGTFYLGLCSDMPIDIIFSLTPILGASSVSF